jgi:superfamily II DNA or RNA helicase
MTGPGALLEMNEEHDLTPGARAERAVSAALADLGSTAGRGVVVDSPPGAGKSTLVVRATAELAAAGEPVMVVAQTNDQVDDLTDRLATDWPDLAIGRLSSQEYVTTDRVGRHRQVRVSARLGELAG